MPKPLVAIIGKPNVGKSTFFNRIASRRIAIVQDTPGVTRDRIFADVDWGRYRFTLVDTGGIDPEGTDSIFVLMREQAQIAMDMADIIVFFVDGKQGMTEDDKDIALMLRRMKKPVVVAVNKMDNMQKTDAIYEFAEMGLSEIIPISASLGLGINDLLDAIVEHMPAPGEEEEEPDDSIKIAIVGKPNVGKSSLLNRIVGENRVIVSDVAGTTRDAIDTPFEYKGEKYVIIDTAGMRRRRSIEKDTVERYGVIRAIAAVRRANVVLIVLDASEGLSEQDVKIAGLAHEEGKASVVIVNKWDLVKKDTHTMDSYRKRITDGLSFMAYVPVLFTSALTGQRIGRIFELVQHVYGQSVLRISTAMLNQVLGEAIAAVEPPSDRGRRLKVFYMTQAGIKPPTFIIFVNDADLMHFSYQRYLENYLRKTFGFEGTPIRFIIRQREGQEGR